MSFYLLANSYYPEDEAPPLWTLKGYLTIKRLLQIAEKFAAHIHLWLSTNPWPLTPPSGWTWYFHPYSWRLSEEVNLCTLLISANAFRLWAELFSFMGIFICLLSGSHFEITSESSSLVAMETCFFIQPGCCWPVPDSTRLLQTLAPASTWDRNTPTSFTVKVYKCYRHVAPCNLNELLHQ